MISLLLTALNPFKGKALLLIPIAVIFFGILTVGNEIRTRDATINDLESKIMAHRFAINQYQQVIDQSAAARESMSRHNQILQEQINRSRAQKKAEVNQMMQGPRLENEQEALEFLQHQIDELGFGSWLR